MKKLLILYIMEHYTRNNIHNTKYNGVYITKSIFKTSIIFRSLEKIKLKNICKIIMKIVHSIIYLSIIYIGILKFKI